MTPLESAFVLNPTDSTFGRPRASAHPALRTLGLPSPPRTTESPDCGLDCGGAFKFPVAVRAVLAHY
jgi:hypothetical protein